MSSLEAIQLSPVYLKILLGRPHVDTQIYIFLKFVCQWILSTHVIVIIGDRLYKTDLAFIFRK